MNSAHRLVILVTFLGIFIPSQIIAQSPGASTTTARSLDTLLQDYAYRAFVRPLTGVIYVAEAPANVSGIKLSVVRLRSGSFRKRGFPSFNEFSIPPGVIETPYILRFALVYQNLGNWSSVYYQLPGYTFLTPVIGLLAYSAGNLSATNLPELEIVASMKPISIKFTDVSPVPSGQVANCVHFHLNGSYQIGDLVSGNLCTAYTQGHFSIVVNSTTLAPSPAPSQGPPGVIPGPVKKSKSKAGKIVGGVVGGFLALVLLVLLMIWLHKYRQNKKMTNMVRRSEAGEVLTTQRVGNSQLPVATMVRTRPTLENEYVL